MSVQDQVLLDACRAQFATENGFAHLSEDDQFEYFCALQLTKQSETTFSEIEDAITDGGNDGGIDCFLILVNDSCVTTREDLQEIKITSTSTVRVLIVQSKTTSAFREATLNSWITSWPVVCDPSKGTSELLAVFNSSLVEKVELFREIWVEAIRKRATFSIDFRYCTRAESMQVNGVINAKKAQFHHVAATLVRCPISVEFLGAVELMALYQQNPNQKLELSFESDPTSISLTKEKFGYIGVVRLHEYLRFISDQSSGKIRESIFEANVRHFLGEVDVNKKIAETLQVDRENDFWWFNNGITIIAEQIAQLPKALHMDNVKIINGLQTSFTLFENKDAISPEDPRTLLVKVVRSVDKVVIDKIINASNFQNGVPPVMLRATDKVQRDIENYCLTEGFFYDRRKGYYKNQGKPAKKIFSIQDFAQAIKSIIFFDPGVARQKPTTIIKSEATYAEVFDPAKPFASYLTAARIVQKVRAFISLHVHREERGLARNFTFHIARVVTALRLSRAEYSHDDVAKIDLDSLSDEFIGDAWKRTLFVLDKYAMETGDNVINIAKAQKFSSYLTTALAREES